MRQLVGCVTCARVDWIDEFVPCYLFKDCPDELFAQDNSDSEASADTDSTDEEETATAGQALLRDDAGTTYAVLQPSTLSWMSGSTAGRGL